MTSTLTRAEAAEVLGVSVQTVDVYGRTGLLTRHRNALTRRVWYDADQVKRLRDERATGSDGAA